MAGTTETTTGDGSVRVRSPLDREILTLALPALGALAADPLVSMVDTAFVGRLGVTPLGALGVNAAVFSMAFVVFNFLAYGTTPMIARAVGRGDVERAGRLAVEALVLAGVAGVAALGLIQAFAGPILAAAAAVLLLVVPMGWGLTGVWWGIVALMATRAVTLAGRYLGLPGARVP